MRSGDLGGSLRVSQTEKGSEEALTGSVVKTRKSAVTEIENQFFITEEVQHESLDSSQVASVIVVSQSDKLTKSNKLQGSGKLIDASKVQNNNRLVQLESLKD